MFDFFFAEKITAKLAKMSQFSGSSRLRNTFFGWPLIPFDDTVKRRMSLSKSQNLKLSTNIQHEVIIVENPISSFSSGYSLDFETWKSILSSFQMQSEIRVFVAKLRFFCCRDVRKDFVVGLWLSLWLSMGLRRREMCEGITRDSKTKLKASRK